MAFLLTAYLIPFPHAIGEPFSDSLREGTQRGFAPLHAPFVIPAEAEIQM